MEVETGQNLGCDLKKIMSNVVEGIKTLGIESLIIHQTGYDMTIWVFP